MNLTTVFRKITTALLLLLLALAATILQAAPTLNQPVNTTFRITGNPIIKKKYTADPGAIVHQDKVYLYTGHDEAPPRRDGYVMKE